MFNAQPTGTVISRRCIASSALFRHILKEVRVCFSSYVGSKKNFSRLDVQARIQPFFLFNPYMKGFGIFTTATRKVIGNTILTKSMYLSYLLCINKFGLPPSASCPVNRNVNDEACLPLVSVSKRCRFVFEVWNHVHINKIRREVLTS